MPTAPRCRYAAHRAMSAGHRGVGVI